MLVECLTSIRYGQGRRITKLHAGEVVPSDVFKSADLKVLLKQGLIRERVITPDIKPVLHPETEEKSEVPDISSLTAVEAKEVINAETDVVNLHKMLDQERADKKRKSVIEFIESRIKELTGYE